MGGKIKGPAAEPEDDRARIIERPDGFYWRAEESIPRTEDH
jgi:hypothetical protein